MGSVPVFGGCNMLKGVGLIDETVAVVITCDGIARFVAGGGAAIVVVGGG